MKHSSKKANNENTDHDGILLPEQEKKEVDIYDDNNKANKKIVKKIVKKVLPTENNTPDSTQESLDDSNLWISNLVENSSNLMCVVKDGIVSFINKTGVSMLKFMDPLEIIGMPFVDLIDDKLKEIFIVDFENIINSQSPYQTIFVATDNQKLDVELSIIPISSEDSSSFLIEAKNISYLKSIEKKYQLSEQKIKQNFMHDDLTGLPSGNLFEDRLQMAIARAARRAYGQPEVSQNRIAVIIMNVDKIEDIDKELGPEASNHVLRNIAIRLASSFRNCDTIAKDDNKSFLLILEGISNFDDAETVARRTLGIMYEQIGYKGSNLALGCSIGISIFPEHGIKARKLLSAAESALQEVVNRGGNFYMVYDEDLAIS